MMRSVFAKTLYDLRWSIGAFCVGLGLLGFFILYLYPSVADAQREMVSGISDQTAQALLGSLNFAGSPKGFLSLQMFSFQPLYLAVFLIVATSAAIAGEEGEGTLDVLMARPVSRWRILLEKAMAITVGMLLITVATAIGAVTGAAVAGVDIDRLQLALALLNTLPYGIWLLGFGLFCSALFRSRMTAALVATGVVVAGYMLNSLSDFVSSLDTVVRGSPMYYYGWGEPLLQAMEWENVAILTGAGLLFFALAWIAFERREVYA